MYGQLTIGSLVVELATDVDVRSTSAHGGAGHQTAFDELVWVVTHDLTVLTRAWLALVSIYHQVSVPSKHI